MSWSPLLESAGLLFVVSCWCSRDSVAKRFVTCGSPRVVSIRCGTRGRRILDVVVFFWILHSSIEYREMPRCVCVPYIVLPAFHHTLRWGVSIEGSLKRSGLITRVTVSIGHQLFLSSLKASINHWVSSHLRWLCVPCLILFVSQCLLRSVAVVDGFKKWRELGTGRWSLWEYRVGVCGCMIDI